MGPPGAPGPGHRRWGWFVAATPASSAHHGIYPRIGHRIVPFRVLPCCPSSVVSTPWVSGTGQGTTKSPALAQCSEVPMSKGSDNLNHHNHLEALLGDLSEEDRPLAQRLIRLLTRLHKDRRRDPLRQNHVGSILYDLCNGSSVGLVVWMTWLKGWSTAASGLNRAQVLDYMEQWRMFAIGGGAARAYSAEMRMQALLEQDMSKEERQRATEADIAELHRSRGHPEPVR